MTIDNIAVTEYPIIREDNTCIVSDSVIVSNCETDEDKNIKGIVYLSDNHTQKAFFNNSKMVWYFGMNIGRYNNLVSLKDRTDKEREEIIAKSRIARKENTEKKRNINDLAKAMLEQSLTESQISEILGTSTNMLLDDSVASVMLAKMIQTALQGSFKAFETVRDTAGYRPKDVHEVQADVMTDADRRLIENVSKRIG